MAVCYKTYYLMSNSMNIQRQLFLLRARSLLCSSGYGCKRITHPSPQTAGQVPPTPVLHRSYYSTFGSACHLLKPHPLTWSACRTYAKKGKDKGGKPHKKVSLTDDQLEGLINKEKLQQEFNHVLDDLKDKFIHQITVRTTQGAFDSLIVKTPDGNFPLIQLGQVVQKSPQLLTINMASSPQYIVHVKEALTESGLNINPQQDGTSLFIPLPKVTREHRENLAKNAKVLSEKSKKQIRDIYSKYSRKIKSSKEGHSSDDLIAADDLVKDMMHGMLHSVEEMTTAKQQELLGGK